MIDWNRVTTHNNPNEMWDFWKHLLVSVIDKYTPFRTKRVKNKRSPWITNELLREIHKRDFLKKKAASTNDPSIWKKFEDAQNKANNSVKKAKRKYFSENLDANKSDPRKTWRLINELQSRQSKSTKVSQVKTGNQVFTSPGDIAEAFNNHFTNMGQSLAQEIPNSEIDPLAFVNPVDGVFSFQHINVQKSSNYLTEQYPVTAHALNFDFWTGCREIKRCVESKRTLKNPFASRLAEFNTTLKLLRITDQ